MLIRRSKRKESAQPDTLLSTASSGGGGGGGGVEGLAYCCRVCYCGYKGVTSVELIGLHCRAYFGDSVLCICVRVVAYKRSSDLHRHPPQA